LDLPVDIRTSGFTSKSLVRLAIQSTNQSRLPGKIRAESIGAQQQSRSSGLCQKSADENSIVERIRTGGSGKTGLTKAT